MKKIKLTSVGMSPKEVKERLTIYLLTKEQGRDGPGRGLAGARLKKVKRAGRVNRGK